MHYWLNSYTHAFEDAHSCCSAQTSAQFLYFPWRKLHLGLKKQKMSQLWYNIMEATFQSYLTEAVYALEASKSNEPTTITGSEDKNQHTVGFLASVRP